MSLRIDIVAAGPFHGVQNENSRHDCDHRLNVERRSDIDILRQYATKYGADDGGNSSYASVERKRFAAMASRHCSSDEGVPRNHPEREACSRSESRYK